MAGKLVRNTSNKESRDWWEAVEKAAAAAVDLEWMRIANKRATTESRETIVW